MLKTVFALGVEVLLAGLTLHKGMGRLMERAQAGKRMRVIERVALDARRSLFLVEVDGRTLVVGGGDVTRLDAPSSGISFSDGAALRAAAFDKVLAQTSGGAATTTTTTTTATEPA
jgi:flagellar biogenesis protein FliO